MRPTLPLALITAGVAVALLAWGWRAPATPRTGSAPPSAAPASPATDDPVANVPMAAPARPQAASGAEDRLELPDGTSVPMLNGARGALSLAECWGPRPWSPIVGVERTDAGVDWYVHADGTRSTTEMKWRPDLGRPDAVTRIALPRADTPAVGAGG